MYSMRRQWSGKTGQKIFTPNRASTEALQEGEDLMSRCHSKWSDSFKIGFGTADLARSASEAVFDAVNAGYFLIDTAQVYGSEHGVGEAVKRAVSEGVVRREDLFVQTKLAQNRHGYYEAMDAFQESLQQLQMDYVDMYLIHWPVARGSEETYREKNLATWQAFQELKNQGKVRHIGVCNFLERHLLQLADNGMADPEVNQLELHPGYQQCGLVRFCRERGIAIEAWSPMGRGILRTPEFEAMAQRYGKNIGQLALRWSVQNGFIPISRSSDAHHIAANLDIFDFTITDEDMAALNRLNTNDGHMDIWSYRRQQMY